MINLLFTIPRLSKPLKLILDDISINCAKDKHILKVTFKSNFLNLSMCTVKRHHINLHHINRRHNTSYPASDRNLEI